jgi:hypothetical protein
MSFRAALATRNLEFSAGESGDDGIRDALPLSYTAEAMAGVEPATFGLEVTVVFTTGELQIPRSTRQFANANRLASLGMTCSKGDGKRDG